MQHLDVLEKKMNFRLVIENFLSTTKCTTLSKTYNPQGQINSKDGFDFEYKAYIQVSKKTINRIVDEDQRFSIKNRQVFFQSDRNIYNVIFYSRTHKNTFTAVKVLSKRKS